VDLEGTQIAVENEALLCRQIFEGFIAKVMFTTRISYASSDQ
jgi:hypothetical protein